MFFFRLCFFMAFFYTQSNAMVVSLHGIYDFLVRKEHFFLSFIWPVSLKIPSLLFFSPLMMMMSLRKKEKNKLQFKPISGFTTLTRIQPHLHTTKTTFSTMSGKGAKGLSGKGLSGKGAKVRDERAHARVIHTTTTPSSFCGVFDSLLSAFVFSCLFFFFFFGLKKRTSDVRCIPSPSPLPSTTGHHVRQEGRQEEAHLALREGGPAVPRRPHPQVPQGASLLSLSLNMLHRVFFFRL